MKDIYIPIPSSPGALTTPEGEGGVLHGDSRQACGGARVRGLQSLHDSGSQQLLGRGCI